MIVLLSPSTNAARCVAFMAVFVVCMLMALKSSARAERIDQFRFSALATTNAPAAISVAAQR